MRLRAGAIVAAVALAVALSLGSAPRARAQAPLGGGAADVIRRGLIHGGARLPAGFYRFVATHPGAFEFRHGWLARARLVRERRQALRSRGAWQLLRLPAGLAGAAAQAAPAAAGTAVSGTLRYPTFLPLFSNTAPADSTVMDPAAVASEFWGTAPAPPYSITTYYQEISNGQLTVTGTVIAPIRLPQTDTFYSGGPGCYGLYCGDVPLLIHQLLDSADATVDFAQFADSTTNYVPAIVILDPQVGGECYQVYPPAANSIWAHRFSLSGWGVGAYQTKDSLNGKPVYVDDYIIQGGEGGGQGTTFPGCTPGYLAPIGTVTHETGHLFGLPDLYDTGPLFQTEGIGRWDLMSAGNELRPWRPAHMSAWSLATLGWINEVPVTTAQTDTAAPIETGRTAYVLPVAGAATEFFVMENRQQIGSDSMMYGPGLMIYHLDTALMAARTPSNNVNAVFPHALAVEEAAGDTGLDCSYPAPCNDRGDAGDPFPGSSGNPVFAASTRPAALTNAGAFAGLRVDSIRQLVPGGAMAFRVTFGTMTRVAASDTAAVVAVDGVAAHNFRDVFTDGSSHTIAIDSVQLSGDGRTQFRYQSWSDAGAATHTITGALAGAAYTASVRHRYLVNLARVGGGSVTATTAIDSVNGSFLDEGVPDTLVARAGAGETFAGWTADTITGSPMVVLTPARPYRLVATFVGTADVVRELLTGASGLNAGQLTTLDYLGNRNLRFDLGDFVAWLDRNAGSVGPGAFVRSGRWAGATR